MWIWISMACAALSLYLIAWWFGRPYVARASAAVAAQPLLLRAIWPWVDAVAFACQPLMSWQLRRRLEHLLRQAGMSSPWSPQHFCALQCLAGMAAGGITVLALYRSFTFTTVLACAVGAAGLAAFLPAQKVAERIRRRRHAMLRELPFLLDMVTLCVEAGLNLHGALQQAAANGPAGPLRDELRHMLSDIRTGAARQDALAQWAQRCDLPALHHFVAAAAQAGQSGMSLGPVLRAQADQRRSERFQCAEKLALEAPVKLMFPLVTCIFPCSFLIIAFPIAGKFLALME